MVSHSLVVRLDNAGDVLLAGPAVRAVAAASDRVTFLAGPNGAAAAGLLPGVDEVIVWRCPWIDPEPGAVDPEDVTSLMGMLSRLGIDRALVLTSFHQSPLPMALVLRLAGVPWVGAISEDYPGSLLDLRHRIADDVPEAERGLSLATTADFALPAGDDGRLALRKPLPRSPAAARAGLVVLHPGTSVPARAWPADRYAELCSLLVGCGYEVVVTGTAAERPLTAQVVGLTGARDLAGRTSFEELAAVLEAAEVVVVGNTGPAHLAAAVGTPVVSLYAPTVPSIRWAPYGVPTVLLGDQQAVCRDTRVTVCPFPGHPCLSAVTAVDALRAVEQLCGPIRPNRDELAAEEVVR